MANTHFVNITTDETTIASDLTTPVVWLDLQRAPAAFWTNLGGTDGGEIRVYNQAGNTQFPAYVLYINTVAQTGLVAARVDTMSASTATVYRVEFGDAALAAEADGAAYGRNNVFQDYEGAWNFTTIAGSAPEIEDMTGNGHDGTLDNNGAFAQDTSSAFWDRGVRLTSATSTGASVNLAIATGLDGDATALRTFTWAQVAFSIGSNNDVFGVSGTDRLRNNAGNYLLRIASTNYLGAVAGPTVGQQEVFSLLYNGSTDVANLFRNGASIDSDTGVTDPWPTGSWALMNASQTATTANDASWYVALWANAARSDAERNAESDMMRDNAVNFWTWGTVTETALEGYIVGTFSMDSAVAGAFDMSEAIDGELDLTEAVDGTFNIEPT